MSHLSKKQLSISNIAWDAEHDFAVYGWMKELGYSCLEIAPTRIFPWNPYSRLDEAREWSQRLGALHGFAVSSMQSIWYGRTEKIFGSFEERRILIEYTKKAVDFAQAIGCRNLVFGCPRNRCIPQGMDAFAGVLFFREIGNYAFEHGTVIAIEANPPIYNTNYINTTESAFLLMEEVDSAGFKLNLDVGTMIANGESVELLKGRAAWINHVHMSEPGLKPIKHRPIHQKLRDFFQAEGYEGCISIEMGKTEIEMVKDAMEYVREIFG